MALYLGFGHDFDIVSYSKVHVLEACSTGGSIGGWQDLYEEGPDGRNTSSSDSLHLSPVKQKPKISHTG